MHEMQRDGTTLLTTPEAARRLGITTRAVYDLIEAGQLPVIRTDDGPKVPEAAIKARLD